MIPLELHDKIIRFLEENPVQMYWDHRAEITDNDLKEILEKGLEQYEDELYDFNLDYICDCKREFINEELYNEFKDELTYLWEMTYPGGDYEDVCDKVKEYLQEEYFDEVNFDMDMDHMINQTEDITCMIKVYSNYDCCNSFDEFVPGGYLYEVFKRIHQGVKKDDYIYEFHNGAYGGSLFCFVFKTDLKRLLEMKKELRTADTIRIPKGTEFGFFSDFQGCGSMFEKVTYKIFNLNVKEQGGEYYPEYDHIDIVADVEQGGYTMDSVYGGLDISPQCIELNQEERAI